MGVGGASWGGGGSNAEGRTTGFNIFVLFFTPHRDLGIFKNHDYLYTLCQHFGLI
jgi:hypothetical protein